MPAKTKFELKPGLATREAFGKALAELGKVNPNVVVLDADLSKSTYTAEFGKAFPGPLFRMRHRRGQHGGDRRGPRVGGKNSVRIQLLCVSCSTKVSSNSASPPRCPT